MEGWVLITRSDVIKKAKWIKYIHPFINKSKKSALPLKGVEPPDPNRMKKHQ